MLTKRRFEASVTGMTGGKSDVYVGKEWPAWTGSSHLDRRRRCKTYPKRAGLD